MHTNHVTSLHLCVFWQDPLFSDAMPQFTSLKIEAISPASQAVSCFNWMKCCPRCCSPLCLSITNTIGVALVTVTIFSYIASISKKQLFDDSIRAAVWTPLAGLWSVVTVVVIFASIFITKPCVRVTAAVFALILGVMVLNLAMLFAFEWYGPDMMSAEKWSQLDPKKRRALEEAFRCCGWDYKMGDPDCYAALRYYDLCGSTIEYYIDNLFGAMFIVWSLLGPWMILWSSIMLCVVVPEKEEGLELKSQSGVIGFPLTQPYDAPAFNANVYGNRTW